MLFQSLILSNPECLKREAGQEAVGWKEGRPLPGESLTRAPQLLALLLVGEAHAVVAVGLAILARGAVHLVEVGGALGGLSRAELREVALPCLFTAHRARGQQLSRGTRRGDKVNLPPIYPQSSQQALMSITPMEQNFPLPLFQSTFYMTSLA